MKFWRWICYMQTIERLKMRSKLENEVMTHERNFLVSQLPVFVRWLVDVAWQVNSSFIKNTVYFEHFHYSAVIIVTSKCALETLKRATESRLTIEFIIKVKTPPSQKWLKFMLSILIPFSQTKNSCKVFVVSCTVYKNILCVHFLNCVRSRHA